MWSVSNKSVQLISCPKEVSLTIHRPWSMRKANSCGTFNFFLYLFFFKYFIAVYYLNNGNFWHMIGCEVGQSFIHDFSESITPVFFPETVPSSRLTQHFLQPWGSWSVVGCGVRERHQEKGERAASGKETFVSSYLTEWLQEPPQHCWQSGLLQGWAESWGPGSLLFVGHQGLPGKQPLAQPGAQGL